MKTGLLCPQEDVNIEVVLENLSDGERNYFLEAFNQIDTDKTGTIDKHELGAFLALQWRHAVPNETIDSIITLVDDNGDGKIQFDEFVMLQLKFIPLCKGYCKDCKKIIIGMLSVTSTTRIMHCISNII